jgi:CRP-like cAMP-binding protein
LTSLLPLFRIASLSNGWFDLMPSAVREDILARCKRHSLAAGERLFSRSDLADGCYCVLEGAVRLSGVSGGRETVLDFYGPKIWFGEVSALDGLPRVHDAQGEVASLLLHLTQADFEDLLAVHPAFGRNLLRLAAMRLRILLTAIESYSIQSLEQRLGNRLLMLAVMFGVETKDGLKLDLHLPQEILAQLIGSTRQRVNQIFKDWELAGIATQQYGRVILMDRARLEALAEM